MAKNHMLRIRLHSEDYLELRRAAAAHRLSVAAYCTRILFYHRYEATRREAFSVGPKRATNPLNRGGLPPPR